MDTKVATTGPILGDDVCQIGQQRVAYGCRQLRSVDNGSWAGVIGF